MSNIKSEQLRSDLSLELDFDQPLRISEIIDSMKLLGSRPQLSTG